MLFAHVVLRNDIKGAVELLEVKTHAFLCLLVLTGGGILLCFDQEKRVAILNLSSKPVSVTAIHIISLQTRL